MEQLEEKVGKDFSLISFFTVTGLCFFLFSFVIKMLDGLSMPIFNKTGAACMILAFVCLLLKWMVPANKSRSEDLSALPAE